MLDIDNVIPRNIESVQLGGAWKTILDLKFIIHYWWPLIRDGKKSFESLDSLALKIWRIYIYIYITCHTVLVSSKNIIQINKYITQYIKILKNMLEIDLP